MDEAEATCRLALRGAEELKREGWTFRFIASGARLWEMVKAYEDTGFEVHLEPVRPEDLEGPCRQCIEAEPETVYAVYTRPKGGAKLDELYE